MPPLVSGSRPEGYDFRSFLTEPTPSSDPKSENNHFAPASQAALRIWSLYIQEGEAITLNQARGWLGRTFEFVDGFFRKDGKSMSEDLRDRWDLERKLLQEVEHRLSTHKSETIEESLRQISQSGPEFFQKRATELLAEFRHRSHDGGWLLGHVLRYASLKNPSQELAEELFQDADQTEIRYTGARTPFAIYALLEATSPDPRLKSFCTQKLESFQEEPGFLRSVVHMVRSLGTDDLAQMATMAAATKVGALARLATLEKLQAVGVTGQKAIALGWGAHVATEGTALWAMNAAQESAFHDLRESLDPSHLAKSWGANLVMVGTMKPFGLMGGATRAHFEKVARNMGENFWAKKFATQALGWSAQHVFGVSGMVASGQANQGLGLIEKSRGGFMDSLLHDTLSYVKYGFAQEGFDHLLGESFVRKNQRLKEKINRREVEHLSLERLKAKKSPKYSHPILHPLVQPVFLALGAGGLGGFGGFGGGEGPGKEALVWAKYRSTILKAIKEAKSNPEEGAAKLRLLPIDALRIHALDGRVEAVVLLEQLRDAGHARAQDLLMEILPHYALEELKRAQAGDASAVKRLMRMDLDEIVDIADEPEHPEHRQALQLLIYLSQVGRGEAENDLRVLFELNPRLAIEMLGLAENTDFPPYRILRQKLRHYSLNAVQNAAIDRAAPLHKPAIAVLVKSLQSELPHPQVTRHLVELSQAFPKEIYSTFALQRMSYMRLFDFAQEGDKAACFLLGGIGNARPELSQFIRDRLASWGVYNIPTLKEVRAAEVFLISKGDDEISELPLAREWKVEEEGTYILGRGPEKRGFISIPDPSISRNHAWLKNMGGRYWLKPLVPAQSSPSAAHGVWMEMRPQVWTKLSPDHEQALRPNGRFAFGLLGEEEGLSEAIVFQVTEQGKLVTRENLPEIDLPNSQARSGEGLSPEDVGFLRSSLEDLSGPRSLIPPSLQAGVRDSLEKSLQGKRSVIAAASDLFNGIKHGVLRQLQEDLIDAESGVKVERVKEIKTFPLKEMAEAHPFIGQFLRENPEEEHEVSEVAFNPNFRGPIKGIPDSDPAEIIAVNHLQSLDSFYKLIHSPETPTVRHFPLSLLLWVAEQHSGGKGIKPQWMTENPSLDGVRDLLARERWPLTFSSNDTASSNHPLGTQKLHGRFRDPLTSAYHDIYHLLRWNQLGPDLGPQRRQDAIVLYDGFKKVLGKLPEAEFSSATQNILDEILSGPGALGDSDILYGQHFSTIFGTWFRGGFPPEIRNRVALDLYHQVAGDFWMHPKGEEITEHFRKTFEVPEEEGASEKSEEGLGGKSGPLALLGFGSGLATLLAAEHAQAADRAPLITGSELGWVLGAVATALAAAWGLGRIAERWNGFSSSRYEVTQRTSDGRPLKAFLLKDQTIQGLQLPKNTDVFFNERGEIEAFRLAAPQKLFGISFLMGDRVRVDKQEGLKAVNLWTTRLFQGHRYLSGDTLNFDAQGKVLGANLRSEQTIQDLPLKANSRVHFHSNGKIKTALLAHDKVIRGIPCAEGSLISFHEDGRLKATALSRDFKIGGKVFPKNSRIYFNSEGERVDPEDS